jgi:hypothetical protein
MTDRIDRDRFTKELFDLLDEAFACCHGIFLDDNTSLFETLATISAEEASVPVGGKCATLAAQVAHVTFYLDVNEAYILHKDVGKVDWNDIWVRVKEVTPQEWAEYQARLKATYQRLLSRMQGFDDWNDERRIGGALSIVAHTAYHLGEIRQAMCTVKK